MDGQDQISLNNSLKKGMKFWHLLGMRSLCNNSGPISSMAWSSLIRIIPLLKKYYIINEVLNENILDKMIRIFF